MLIVPSRQSLIVKAPEPEQVLSCIPTAKLLNWKGVDLVVVPHRLDEVRVLRNLGHRPPSPMGFYYDYPLLQGKYPPFEHQKKTSAFLTLHPRCAVLNEPRTGKSGSCLWSFDYLRKQGCLRKMLIVAPLSTLDPVWAAEIFQSFWWYKFVVVYGSREKRLALLKEPADIYIINHHGLAIIANDLPEDIDLLVYDEANVLRNPRAGFFRTLDSLLGRRPNLWLWLLTGTPTPNEPTDAWALCKLIGAKVPRFSAFRDMLMYKAGPWAWRAKPEAAQLVSQYLQPSIRFKRDDCFDLPAVMYETRKCELSAQQKNLVQDMLRSLQADVAGHQVTAVSEAAKVQKLIQILLGAVYTDSGETAVVVAPERVNVIKEVIEECDEKVIVFVPFTGALHRMVETLSQHFTVEMINGTVSKSRRDSIFQRFQNEPEPRVIVADARTMSHGLDLTAATTIIWAGPTNSNDVYEQACARIWGPKQKHKTSIVHIEATDIERRIYKRLREKQSMQGLLLDIVQSLGDN